MRSTIGSKRYPHCVIEWRSLTITDVAAKEAADGSEAVEAKTLAHMHSFGPEPLYSKTFLEAAGFTREEAAKQHSYMMQGSPPSFYSQGKVHPKKPHPKTSPAKENNIYNTKTPFHIKTTQPPTTHKWRPAPGLTPMPVPGLPPPDPSNYPFPGKTTDLPNTPNTDSQTSSHPAHK